MLGGLQGHVHAGQRSELAGPHAGRVDHDLGLDLALLGQHGGDPASMRANAGRGDALDHVRAQWLAPLPSDVATPTGSARPSSAT